MQLLTRHDLPHVGIISVRSWKLKKTALYYNNTNLKRPLHLRKCFMMENFAFNISNTVPDHSLNTDFFFLKKKQNMGIVCQACCCLGVICRV